MIVLQSDFYFKGERPYVHGPTLFELFRQYVENCFKSGGNSIYVRNFKVHQYIKQNYKIKIYAAPELSSEEHKKNLLAEMAGKASGADFFLGLYDEQPSPIIQRRPSLEKQFVKSVEAGKPFCGAASLVNMKTHYDMIQAMIEANKQIHLLSLPKDKAEKEYQFKFASCANFEIPAQVNDPNGRLQIENVGLKESEYHYLTLNRLSLLTSEREHNLVVCFSFKRQ